MNKEDELKDIFENLEEEEKIIIFSLGALDGSPLRSKIKLQKLLFLISNVFKNYEDLLEFEPHLFGPYSENIEYIVEDLIKLGLIEKEGIKYTLTNEGKKLYQCLKPKEELVNVIEDFKEFLNDLSDEEVLVFVYVTYPNYIEESAKWEELKQKRIPIAISLLKKQKISFGKAVEISGLSLGDFEELINEKKIKWKTELQKF